MGEDRTLPDAFTAEVAGTDELSFLFLQKSVVERSHNDLFRKLTPFVLVCLCRKDGLQNLLIPCTAAEVAT